LTILIFYINLITHSLPSLYLITLYTKLFLYSPFQTTLHTTRNKLHTHETNTFRETTYSFFGKLHLPFFIIPSQMISNINKNYTYITFSLLDIIGPPMHVIPIIMGERGASPPKLNYFLSNILLAYSR